MAAVTGAASVALVGLFALTVTPSNSPVMVTNSTLTPSVMAANASTTSTTFAEPVVSSDNGGVDVASPSGEAAADMTVVMVDASVTIHTSHETDANGFPLATVYFSPRLSARGSLIAEAGDFSIVRLDPHRPQDHDLVEKLELTEYVVASSMPHHADEVTALGGSPQHARLDDLDELELEPGTAVVDQNNHLFAVSGDGGNLTLVAPNPNPNPDPDSDPAPVTTDDEVVTTTSDPTTTEPPTTPEPTESTTPDTTTVPPTSVENTSPSTTPAPSSTPDETTTTVRDTSPGSTKTTTTSVAKSSNDEPG